MAYCHLPRGCWNKYLWRPWCDVKGHLLEVTLPGSHQFFNSGRRTFLFPRKIKKRKFSCSLLSNVSFLFTLKPKWNTAFILIPSTHLLFNMYSLSVYSLFALIRLDPQSQRGVRNWLISRNSPSRWGNN